MTPVFLLEDDWELRGTGLGDVAQLQYLPALFLMDRCAELDMRCTFMVEVMQQLAFEERAKKDRRCAATVALWKESLFAMLDRGHDVQLHLHPQWLGAEWRDGYFYPTKPWNLAAHPPAQQGAMLDAALEYLANVFREVGATRPIVAFKAGAWALQPSAVPLTLLAERGISVIMGPGRGIHFHSDAFVADYRNIEEDTVPYHPERVAVERVGNDADLVVLPMPFYVRKPLRIASLAASSVVRKALRRPGAPARHLELSKEVAAPMALRASSPIAGVTVRSQLAAARAAFAGDAINFDISVVNAEEALFAVRQIVARAESRGGVFPIVLQSHTKGYDKNWSSVAAFYRGIRKTWPDARFITATDFAKDSGSFRVRSLVTDAG